MRDRDIMVRVLENQAFILNYLYGQATSTGGRRTTEGLSMAINRTTTTLAEVDLEAKTTREREARDGAM